LKGTETMNNKVIDSPVGDLEWVHISGEGKPDLQGLPKYQVDVVLTPEQAEPFKALVAAYWEENKPKGAKAPKSTGIYPHTVKDDKATKEAGENVYEPTGKTVVRFKTGTTYQSGDTKIIKVFNSKGNEVSLQGKKVGNGSRGRVNGVMAIYINKATSGVTFYLNAIQLSKFVEWTGGADFDTIDEEDGGFEGVEGVPTAIAEEDAERPRL
jgi:hypothetical protein